MDEAAGMDATWKVLERRQECRHRTGRNGRTHLRRYSRSTPFKQASKRETGVKQMKERVGTKAEGKAEQKKRKRENQPKRRLIWRSRGKETTLKQSYCGPISGRVARSLALRELINYPRLRVIHLVRSISVPVLILNFSVPPPWLLRAQLD